MDHKLAIEIRTKKLGILMRDARLEAGESMKACGEVLGKSGRVISRYESGEDALSLPELEILAYFLDLPLERFWGEETHSGVSALEDLDQVKERLEIRQRLIGARLRQVREELGLTMKEIAQTLDITQYRLRSYEMGEFPIPVPELEAMLAIYDLELGDFMDHGGLIGTWAQQKRNMEKFLKLPLEMQEFVVKPIHEPYLKIAKKLSEMSVEELRGIAENLLDITF
jgi:transcriptional regulator with XRE-family HTH domain